MGGETGVVVFDHVPRPARGAEHHHRADRRLAPPVRRAGRRPGPSARSARDEDGVDDLAGATASASATTRRRRASARVPRPPPGRRHRGRPPHAARRAPAPRDRHRRGVRAQEGGTARPVCDRVAADRPRTVGQASVTRWAPRGGTDPPGRGARGCRGRAPRLRSAPPRTRRSRPRSAGLRGHRADATSQSTSESSAGRRDLEVVGQAAVARRHDAARLGQVAGAGARRRTTRTRSHSLDDVAGPAAQQGVGDRAGDRRARGARAVRGAARRPRTRPAAARRRSALERARLSPEWTTTISAPAGIATGSMDRSAKSISSAHPSCAALTTSWSMIPVGHARGGLLGVLARAGQASPGRPRIRRPGRAATSRAALDDSPAPTGSVVTHRAAATRGGADRRRDGGDVAGPTRLEGSRARRDRAPGGVHVGGLGLERRPQHDARCRRRARTSPWCRGRWPWAGRGPRCSRCGRR